MRKLMCVLPLLGCAALKPLPKQALACEKAAALDHFQDLYAAANAALSQATHAEATAALDALVSSQGEAAACAIADLVQDLETAAAGTAPAMLTSTAGGPSTATVWVKLVRVQSWMASQPFRGAPRAKLVGSSKL